MYFKSSRREEDLENLIYILFTKEENATNANSKCSKMRNCISYNATYEVGTPFSKVFVCLPHCGKTQFLVKNQNLSVDIIGLKMVEFRAQANIF